MLLFSWLGSLMEISIDLRRGVSMEAWFVVIGSIESLLLLRIYKDYLLLLSSSATTGSPGTSIEKL